VSGGTTIKAPSGVRYGEGYPLPSRLGDLGEHHELPSGVRGEVPAAIAFSAYFRPENASGSKKNTKNCKFHFEKVVVTVTTTFKSGGDKSPSSHSKLRLWSERPRTTVSVGALHPGLRCLHAPASAFRQPIRTESAPIQAKLGRYNWHSAGSLGWPFPAPEYECISQIIRYIGKQFYQTALVHCYALKLPKADCSSKNKFAVSFITMNFRHTLVPCWPSVL